MGVISKTMLVGSLALLASTGLVGAADMAYPEPPVVEAEPLPVSTGGWYIRGDVGAGIVEHDGWQLDALTAAGGRFLTDDIGDTFFVGAGVGVHVNRYVRVEVTGEYRGSLGISATDEYPFDCGAGWGGGSCAGGGIINRNNVWDGKLSSTVFMLNGLVDIAHFNGLTPFVGAGIGAAYNVIHGLRDHDPSDLGGAGNAGRKGTWNLAWALQAGLAYEATDRLTLEAGYRFLSIGDAESGRINCLPSNSGCGFEGVKIKDIYSHDLRLGMRWELDAPTPVFAEPEYPIVRKF